MIQVVGLTDAPRGGRPPCVADLSFEAPPGAVTVLLGPEGAGKTAALRLMLRLRPGRGIALFRGRPLHRMPQPAREVGTLLGDPAGHPSRTVLGQLRMLAAGYGVPAERATHVLDIVGLSGLAGLRLGGLSQGMERRLGMAAALLGDPHTLLLDDPSHSLAPREALWLRGLLRGYAEQGGTVLTTTRDPLEAARIADRVVSLDGGRLLADQRAEDFRRTRMRPRVAVHSPHAARLATVLGRELRARPGNGAAEVVTESAGRLSVYGADCAEVGEAAHRHRILVHRLADETGPAGDGEAVRPLLRADGRGGPRPAARQSAPAGRRPALPPPGPSWPFSYELRRWAGLPGHWWALAVVLLGGLLVALALTLSGEASAGRVVTGWAAQLPLPPPAVGAGVLGALAFGQEYRYPALAPAQAPLPRRLGLLLAKLALTGVLALVMCAATGALAAAAIGLLFDPGALRGAPEGVAAAAVWGAGVATAGAAPAGILCAWSGLLAAGVFRSAIAGLVAVAAAPGALAPALRALFEGPLGAVPPGGPHALALRVLPETGGSPGDMWLMPPPVGLAMALSLAVLLCGYVLLAARPAPR